MCNWEKWIWPGILATLALTALAVFMKSGSIEQDLTAKATSNLSAQNDWASVELDGRDLKLLGVAPSPAAQADALKIAGEAYDVRVVEDASTLMAIANPFVLSAIKGDGNITLDGYVSSEIERQEILAIAAKSTPGATIVDKLSLARGAPTGFAALAGFGINQLAKLDSGSASLDGLALSVTGATSSSDVYEAITGTLKESLPGNGRLSVADISAPMASPYTISAEKSSNVVVLEGYYPSNAVRATMVDAAKKANPGREVVDNLKFALGSPPEIGALASFGFSQLSGLVNGKVSISDNVLSVDGAAANPQTYDSTAAALAGALPGGGVLASVNIAAPVVSPYTFSVSKKKGIVVLEGYMPTAIEQAAAVAYVDEKIPGERIIDRLVVANGVPDGVNWRQATRQAIRLAGMLSEGESNIRNDAYSVSGTAKSNTAFKDARSEANSELAGGLKLASQDIRRLAITPYVWSFTNMADGAPTLSGYIPGNKLGKANEAQVMAALGSDKSINNKMELGGGAPRNIDGATSVAIQVTSRLLNGKASITGTQLMVTGQALSKFAANAIRAQVENGMPAGFTGKHAITVRRAPIVTVVNLDACQALLDEPLKENAILFESAKSDIKPESFGLLDRLAFIIQTCRTANVDVEGHTDSDGSENNNQLLSEQRAQAVRSFLINAGIADERMRAVGYGEGNPIADNSTAEGKAKNRRIVFTVIRN